MFAKKSIMTLCLSGAVAACSGETPEEVLPASSALDPGHVYMLALRDFVIQISDPLGVEPLRLGSSTRGTSRSFVLEDGSVAYVGNGDLYRYAPQFEDAGAPEDRLLLAPACPSGGYLNPPVVRPDGRLVYGCGDSFTQANEYFLDGEPIRGCPPSEVLLASDARGALLCSRTLIGQNLSVIPHDLESRTILTARVRPEGGFLVVAEREGAGAQLYAMDVFGSASELGPYAPFPDRYDGGVLTPRLPNADAIASDGTYYRLFMHNGAQGKAVIFTSRPGGDATLIDTGDPRIARLLTGG